MKNILSNRDSSADSFEAQEDNYAKLRRCGRRDVASCSTCGRIFTLQAMTVHKRTCLENETCQCCVCRSVSEKMKIKNLFRIKEGTPQNEPFSRQVTKIKALFTPRAHDLLFGKKRRFENSSPEKKSLKLKFSERSKSIIKSPLVRTKSVDRDFISVHREKVVLRYGEYLPNKMTSSNNLLLPWASNKSGSLDNTSSISKSVEVNIHACDRKLFCRYCNTHIVWKSFGIHVIQHCKEKNEAVLKCPECYRLFSQPALYLTHYLTHNVDHPILCTSCRCSYLKCISTKCATESKFIENYPHHCYICFSHFTDSKSVINHMHLHSTEVPIKTIQDNVSPQK